MPHPHPKAHDSEDFVTHDISGPSYCSSFLNSIIVPRPIAFITTVGENGVINAAPFSYFNAVCTHPPMISVAIERRDGIRKDTSRNIIEKREFVVNICSSMLAKSVSIAGGHFPPEVSEIDLAKLSLLPSQKIGVPRIANSLAQMECILYQVIPVGKDPTDLILAEVVYVHMHKSILDKQGRVDIDKLNPLARLDGPTFARVHDYFDIPRGL